MEGAPARIDMHFHLEAASNAEEVARVAHEQGTGILAVSVTPEGYERTVEAAASAPNVACAVGLHPWWVEGTAADERRLDRFEEMLGGTRFVGEVGLDFSRKREKTREAQIRAFERIAAACGRAGGKVLSIHAVRAAGEVLDVLERAGCLESCACVFHWFSGTSDELTRARRLGCFFSVGEPMLATRKGREYSRAVERDRLLAETDLPTAWGEPFDASLQAGSLARVEQLFEEIRGERMGEALLANALALLG